MGDPFICPGQNPGERIALSATSWADRQHILGERICAHSCVGTEAMGPWSELSTSARWRCQRWMTEQAKVVCSVSKLGTCMPALKENTWWEAPWRGMVLQCGRSEEGAGTSTCEQLDKNQRFMSWLKASVSTTEWGKLPHSLYSPGSAPGAQEWKSGLFSCGGGMFIGGKRSQQEQVPAGGDEPPKSLPWCPDHRHSWRTGASLFTPTLGCKARWLRQGFGRDYGYCNHLSMCIAHVPTFFSPPCSCASLICAQHAGPKTTWFLSFETSALTFWNCPLLTTLGNPHVPLAQVTCGSPHPLVPVVDFRSGSRNRAQPTAEPHCLGVQPEQQGRERMSVGPSPPGAMQPPSTCVQPVSSPRRIQAQLLFMGANLRPKVV